MAMKKEEILITLFRREIKINTLKRAEPFT
jgi:hypothetical protein